VFLLFIKAVLAVDDLEHLLIEGIEELLKHPVETRPPFDEVRLEVLEQVGEDVLVLLVDDPVRPLEHVVELFFRARQQVHEKICKKKKTKFNSTFKKAHLGVKSIH